MKEKLITTRFHESEYQTLEEKEKTLIDLAVESSRSAYAPYSGYIVGASVLLDNGEIICGNNQENAAYPAGLCAERVAIYYAGAKFPEVRINMIAITARSSNFEVNDLVSPCGSCRQAIAEYEIKQKHNIRLLLHHPDNHVVIAHSMSDLLPFMFKGEELKKY